MYSESMSYLSLRIVAYASARPLPQTISSRVSRPAPPSFSLTAHPCSGPRFYGKWSTI